MIGDKASKNERAQEISAETELTNIALGLPIAQRLTL